MTTSLLVLLVACQGVEPSNGAAPSVSATATAAPSSPSGGGDDLADGHVVVQWKGGSLTYGELRDEIGTQLAQLEMEYLQGRYQTQTQAAEGLGLRAVVKLEATERGMTEETLILAEVEEKVTKPTEQEVEEFYPVVKRQLRNAPLETARPQVEAMLLDRRKAERLQIYIEELRTKYELTLDIPFPDLPRIDMSVDDDPSVGPENAKVTIIEFGDYECGYCARVFATVQQLREEYPNDVRIVYRDFPLSFHKRAIPAAIAANCVGDLGGNDKYWEMHNLLMQNQSQLSDADLKTNAGKMGIDMNAWETCFSSADTQLAEIQKDFAEGEAAGVTGTPAFFINGIFLSGAQPFDQFRTIIERELEG